MGHTLRNSRLGVFAVAVAGTYLGLEVVEVVPMIPDLTSELVVGALLGGRFLSDEK